MKKIAMIFLIAFLLNFLNGCANNSNEILIDNGQQIVKIKVETANDNFERSKGLMFRENLGKDAGMLFIFDSEENRTFWMKNTLIPLDMIFINKELKIVDIKSAVPCKQEPCLLYKSSKPAKYVLEVNGNYTFQQGINVNNKIQKTKLFK